MACDPLTKEDFIELWRRVLPASYTAPIEEEGDGRGMDVPSLQAAIWAEYCENLEVSHQAYFLLPHSEQTRPESSGARKATGTLNAYRAAPTVGDIYIPPGTVFEAAVTDSFGDELVVGRYLLQQPVTIQNGAAGPVSLSVEAEFPGYAGNAAAGLVGRFLAMGRRQTTAIVTGPNEVSRITSPTVIEDSWSADVVNRPMRLVGTISSENAGYPRRVLSFVTGSPNKLTFDPPLDDAADVGSIVTVELEEFEDFGVTITQPAAITGGVGASLDAIGADRGVGRVSGETDDDYRFRMSELADTVSPMAIYSALACALAPCGIQFSVSETRDVQSLMGMVWDVHPFDFGEVFPIGKPSGSQYVGQGGVLIDNSMQTRFFIVTITRPAIPGFGLFLDDGPLANVWDGDQPLDGATSPELERYLSCVGQAWEKLNAIRAAGVGFVIIEASAPQVFEAPFGLTLGASSEVGALDLQPLL